MVIDQSLAGPTSLFVKFSVLQQYGVDKVFFLENNNVDSSQRNVVFLTRGESADRPLAIAGKQTALLEVHVSAGFVTLQYAGSKETNLSAR